MSDSLYPTFDVPDEVSAQESDEETQASFLPSMAFDFESGDFVRNGTGQILQAGGYNAWVQWCLKQIMTPRYGCLAYGDNVGVEQDDISGMDEEEAETLLQTEIKEALLADPASRTQDVTDFSFTWNVDSVYMTCTAIASDGATATLSTYYSV